MPSPFARRADDSLADPLPRDPLPLLRRWLDDAQQRAGLRNPLAMALATRDRDGAPSARMVICRGFDLERGWLVFYTDRRSPKGEQLAAHPRAALLFHWEPLERQVRIEGPVVDSPDAESDAYFAGRPRDAQVAAWTSEQSRPIASRDLLVERLEETRARRGVDLGDPATPPLPRPPFWGGYRVWIATLELWVGQPGRVHDRGCWRRELVADDDGFAPGPWRAERLQP